MQWDGALNSGAHEVAASRGSNAGAHTKWTNGGSWETVNRCTNDRIWVTATKSRGQERRRVDPRFGMRWRRMRAISFGVSVNSTGRNPLVGLPAL